MTDHWIPITSINTVDLSKINMNISDKYNNGVRVSPGPSGSLTLQLRSYSPITPTGMPRKIITTVLLDRSNTEAVIKALQIELAGRKQ